MKKSLFVLAAAGVIAMLSAGCSSLNTNRYGSQPIFRMEVDLVPQLVIGEKRVAGSSECTVYCGFIRVGDLSKQVHGVSFTSGRSLFSGTNVYQRAAIYDACIKSKADMLIASQYTLVTEGHFFKKTVKCKVIGFPAWIKKISVKPANCPVAAAQAQCKAAPKKAAAPKKK